VCDLNNLKNIIMSSLVLQDFQDSWHWMEDPDRGYSATFAYKCLIQKRWETKSFRRGAGVSEINLEV
jgi:hypothetical protein